MSFPARDLRQFLAQVPDPRGRKGTRHPLTAILTAVICAVLSGANGYRPIAQWLHSQPVDFWHFLGFTRRPMKYGALCHLAQASCANPVSNQSPASSGCSVGVSVWDESISGLNNTRTTSSAGVHNSNRHSIHLTS